MEGPRKPRAGFSLRRLPLRQKIGALAAGIVLLMLSTGIISIFLVTRTTHTMQSILNDNQVSYNLQQAIAAESHAFRMLVQTPGEETRKAYDEAAAETARCLAAVPFDYALTGEARYEITWTIDRGHRRQRAAGAGKAARAAPRYRHLRYCNAGAFGH